MFYIFATFVAGIPNLEKHEGNGKAGKRECARETRKNISHEQPSFPQGWSFLEGVSQGWALLSWRQGQAGPGKRDK